MSGAGHIDPANKKIALLISVLALVLALSETLGKGAQTAALSHNIEASNLWSFFQAKTIRLTTVRTVSELAEVELTRGPATETRAAIEKRIDGWKQAGARYDSEPETGEGRKELAARAKDAEARRNRSLAAYHHYELASAGVQIAIVLASASIVTGATIMAWIAGGLGLVGVGFCLIGFLWPTAVHLF